MYTIGLAHASDLSRFFSRQTIHELELTEESACLLLASIDEDDGNVSTGQHKHVGPAYIPSYFYSRVLINNNDVAQMLRPLTHELVSVDDEIVCSTGRTKNISSWPSARTTSSFTYHRIKQSHLNSPPSSSSSLSGNEEEQIDLSGTKFPRFSSNLDGVSNDKKFDVLSQHTVITPQVSRLWSKWKIWRFWSAMLLWFQRKMLISLIAQSRC